MAKRDIKRLEQSVRSSRRALAQYRTKRAERIKELVGENYSDGGTTRRTPINLLLMGMGIHIRHLAGGMPRCKVNSRNDQLAPAADDLERAADVLFEEIDFLPSLRRLLVDAWLGAGIFKIGINKSGTVELGGTLHDVGQPFADVVSLDDFVFDTTATKWEDMWFVGNFYRLSKQDAKDSGLFKGELKTNDKSFVIEDGGDERAEIVSGMEDTFNDEYGDSVALLDVWLPKENRFLTLDVSTGWELVRDEEWHGPERGPYRMLYLQEVPDAIMPLPPAAAWQNLHRVANSILSKLSDQAGREKSVAVFPRGSEEDANSVKSAKDGTVLTLDNPDKAREVRFGGPDQVLMAFFIQIKDLFAWFANNLDTLGGLAPMADTVGQESILNANSSKVIDDMRDRVIGFLKGVMKDLLWYLWYDPLIHVPITKRVPGVQMEIQSTFTADSREGDFLDYNITIDPYSLRYRTPEGQLQKIMMFNERVVVPFLPMMGEQGVMFDIGAMMDEVIDLADIPEARRFIKYMDPQREQSVNNKELVGSPGKPPVTSRNYNRISQSTGGTRTGRDQAMMQSLLSSGANMTGTRTNR